MARATFGAGCFWGVEEAFRGVPGVTDAAVGYMGGHRPSPTYEEVCTDRTGHAEVVQVEFDPAVVSYEQLLETFFAIHDPTTPDRQGPDVGRQYRSVIFYHDDAQRAAAEAAIRAPEVAGRFPRPIVTEVAPASDFWRAEEYHQRYLARSGRPGCSLG